MKIIKETSTELILELKPTFSQVICVPILMLTIPLGILVPYSISKQLFNPIYRFGFELGTIFYWVMAILFCAAYIFVTLLGLYAIYYILRITNLRIDKCKNKISASSITVFGLQKCSFDLQKIKKIETQVLVGTFDAFTPMILMQSGKRFDLWYGLDYKIAVMKTNKVRKFLDFPAEEILGQQ
jgi:hypothetical protein